MSDATGVVVLMGRILFAIYFGAVAGELHRRDWPTDARHHSRRLRASRGLI